MQGVGPVSNPGGKPPAEVGSQLPLELIDDRPSDEGGRVQHLLDGRVDLLFDCEVLTPQVYHLNVFHRLTLYVLPALIFEQLFIGHRAERPGGKTGVNGPGLGVGRQQRPGSHDGIGCHRLPR